MKVRIHHVIIATCLLTFSCVSTKVNNSIPDSIPATALKPFGRYIINNDNNLEMISSAVHFGFSFSGNECQVYASITNEKGHNYLQYELDGVYQKRLRVEGASKVPLTIKALSSGTHTVWIYKATEAHTGAIIINKVSAKNLKALQLPSAPIIEFIGNSITCGAAADASEYPCGTGEYHDQHNAYYAYGPRVARTLGANYIVSSVSGIGVYRNWNSDGPTMPQVYQKVDFQNNNTQQWDFTKYTPRVVSIALGTNDFSGGDGKRPRLPFDTTTFISTYVNFVQLVKSKYPKAQIALLSSPMVNGNSRVVLQNCLTSVKMKVDVLYPKDKKIAMFFFEPMQAHGCGGHPSVADHEILANQLMPFFRKLL